MKVILKENIDNIGYVGDVVDVSRGYARNYLFARGLAMEYNDGNLKSIEHLKQKEYEKRNREIVNAKELAEKINKINLTFQVKAGKDGKLFGSVTNKDIAASLAENHQIEIDRKKIEHSDPLKKIGNYQVTIHLHQEVDANLKVQVAAEEEAEKENKAIEEKNQDVPSKEKEKEE
ncbi:MAG: 50S ribosomal protein L9 [Candidatus Caldatribacteriota bacterium]|jgi:large subunit ribosomal protein L9|nr:50S ribosomal protein L9 [Atribacterota bacterium]MDD3031173.1 50S ribosomal protein L9 [Atribacterota bacterium]MDD3641370.1 50S ribosomal protein L9 [Atribacterota bacterium]MDD4288349.1 50S ribosomal protein L9 [Atribacterota bacterium]MDI9595933.1 50S ribosomal protein L9 [Atribacterota bacterium]